jgi:mycothiol synthase
VIVDFTSGRSTGDLSKVASNLEVALTTSLLPCCVRIDTDSITPFLTDQVPQSAEDIGDNCEEWIDRELRAALIHADISVNPEPFTPWFVREDLTEEVLVAIKEVAQRVIPEKFKFPGLLFRRHDLLNLPSVTPPVGFEIRPIESGEEESAGQALGSAFEDSWPVERVKAELSESEFVKTMFVAVKDGRVAATASAAYNADWGTAGYIHYVAVHPEFQGHALGYWVSLSCLQEFVKLGYTSGVLHTDDFRIPAIKTYLKLGFELDVNAHPSYRRRWRAICKQLEQRG